MDEFGLSTSFSNQNEGKLTNDENDEHLTSELTNSSEKKNKNKREEMSKMMIQKRLDDDKMELLHIDNNHDNYSPSHKSLSSLSPNKISSNFHLSIDYWKREGTGF